MGEKRRGGKNKNENHMREFRHTKTKMLQGKYTIENLLILSQTSGVLAI